MANKKFPMYLPHAFGRNGGWAVSLYDGNAAWQNTGMEVDSLDKARRVARNANSRLRRKEKALRQLGEQVSKAIRD